jgi:hypothetical protein
VELPESSPEPVECLGDGIEQVHVGHTQPEAAQRNQPLLYSALVTCEVHFTAGAARVAHQRHFIVRPQGPQQLVDSHQVIPVDEVDRRAHLHQQHHPHRGARGGEMGDFLPDAVLAQQKILPFQIVHEAALGVGDGHLDVHQTHIHPKSMSVGRRCLRADC